MSRTVILDLDGPVLEGKLRHYRCYADILTEAGYAPMPLEEYWALKRSGADRRRQLQRSGAEALYGEFLQRWLERIEEPRYLAHDAVQPGARERLVAWNAEGVRLVLATQRRCRSNLLRQLAGCGLLPLFADVLSTGSASAGAGKAEMVAALLGDPGSACLWIGDSEADVDAARRLGIRICAVACGVRSAQYLRALRPDGLAPDLSAVNLSEWGPA
jgi:phosphoglycolate phosphatase-like HAD superfamily hydrolase